jgi:hypothetical protein
MVTEQLIRVRLLTGLQPGRPMVAMQRKGSTSACRSSTVSPDQRYHPTPRPCRYSAMQYLYLIALTVKSSCANRSVRLLLSRGEELRHGSMSTKAQASVVLKQADGWLKPIVLGLLKEHLIIEEVKELISRSTIPLMHGAAAQSYPRRGNGCLGPSTATKSC